MIINANKEDFMYIEIGLLILASIFVVIISGLFALVESSIIIMDDIKLHIFMNREDVPEKTKKRVEKIMNKKDWHITAMVVAITFSSILGSSLLGAMSAKYLPQEYIIMFTAALTYFMLVFARTLPKIIANYNYERILIKLSWVARGSYFVNYPFILLTYMWVKIFKLESKRLMSLNELKMIIKHYRKNGIIDKAEQKMLEKIFSIKQVKIGDVIDKHFHPVIMDYNESVLTYRSAFEDVNNKRFFVMHNDQMVGIVFYRDVAPEFVKGGTTAKVSDFTRPAIILETDDNLMDVIVELKENNTALGIVVDQETKTPISTITMKQIYSHILSNDET
jgi:CBS domain containing-hemolysin-like protein